MKSISCINGNITVPREFEISEIKRRLVIRTPWQVRIITLPKKAINQTIRMFFRSKSRGDKPYVPKGYIEFDKVRFKVFDYDQKHLTNSDQKVN